MAIAATKPSTNKTPTGEQVSPEEAVKQLREALQVAPPDEIVRFLNLFVYGESGVGKTYLGGTAADDPKTSPVLFIDVEGGVTTIKERRDVDVVTVRSMKQLENVATKLGASVKDGRVYYGTVVIDSLTELADLDMRVVMKDAYNKSPDKVDIDVPSPREWGKVRNHIRIIVRYFKDLPVHVVWTGHVGIQEADQDKGIPRKFFPGFAGKLSREIPGFMDIVGYYSQKSNNEGVIIRSLQLQGTDRVIAKDRTKALGQMIQDPTIPSIWETIELAQSEREAKN
jgi:phage nucleotide-binding protein